MVFKRGSVEWLCFTAIFMAINITLSSFSIPVPGGHLYLCDVAICSAALLFDPLAAFLIGGVGSFLGDVLFYPPPMFVSLLSHGLQAVLISVISQKCFQKHPRTAKLLALITGSAVMVIGYTLGRAYLYATPEYAVLKLPFEIMQAAIGAIAGLLITGSKPIRTYLKRLNANHHDAKSR